MSGDLLAASQRLAAYLTAVDAANAHPDCAPVPNVAHRFDGHNLLHSDLRTVLGGLTETASGLLAELEKSVAQIRLMRYDLLASTRDLGDEDTLPSRASTRNRTSSSPTPVPLEKHTQPEGPHMANGTEIWPESLKAMSAAGPSRLERDDLGPLREFAAATPPGDADIVVQYAIDDMGFLDTNVFAGGGDRWTQYDPEDGPVDGYLQTWADLSTIMVRDSLSNMVLLRLADAAPATKKQLKAAEHGSLATARGEGLHNGPQLLFKVHGEWIDLEYGVESAYKSGQLVELFPAVSLVWSAPAEE